MSYRNQSFVLLCKINDWFLYEMQHWAEMDRKDRRNKLKKEGIQNFIDVFGENDL